jgi:hypothetical protein
MSTDADETSNADFPTHRGTPMNVGLTHSSPRLIYFQALESHQYSAKEMVLWLDAAEARRLAAHLVDLADHLES